MPSRSGSPHAVLRAAPPVVVVVFALLAGFSPLPKTAASLGIAMTIAIAPTTAINNGRRRCVMETSSRALIERPYSCEPQAVGAVYDRPGFFVQSCFVPSRQSAPECFPCQVHA